ncbi:MAG: hypothetical protein ACK2UK_11465 [Candidatus Promineifilaceae bacterium]
MAGLESAVSRLWRSDRFWLFVGALFIFALTFFSANKDVGSDPKLTLLVSQALIDQGTIRLDAYQEDQLMEFPFWDYVSRTAMIIEHDGHFYPYFPAGPSVMSVPFVWAYNLLGHDMRTADNFDLQILLASLSAAVVFILLTRMGSELVGPRAALLITFFAVTGSSLLSTLGTALWTLNFSALFITMVLLLLVRASPAANKPFNPYFLGLLLFLCYFSRPSTVAFILPVLAYLFWQHRRLFWPAALTAAALLLLSLGWSRLTYGQWLPPYQSLARLQVERTPVLVAVLGSLFSPSRGLFIFSPFLILLPAGALLFWRDLRRQPLFWLGILWFALQLFLVSRAASWWGGFAFGPRLLADTLPGFVLLLFLVWREAAQHGTAGQQRAAAALYISLGLLATAIHLGGLYRPATARWNLAVSPTPTRVSGPLGDLFDWRYAQFLATNDMICRITADKIHAYLPLDETLAAYHTGQVISARADRARPVDLGQAQRETAPSTAPAARVAAAPAAAHEFYLPFVAYGGNSALFIGWETPAGTADQRLSICPEAEILFRLVDEPLSQDTYWLAIDAAAIGEQTVQVDLNGARLGEMTWPDTTNTAALQFPARLLQPGAFNSIRFLFPTAQSPPPLLEGLRLRLDDRRLALSLRSLSITSSAVPSPTPDPPPAYP